MDIAWSYQKQQIQWFQLRVLSHIPIVIQRKGVDKLFHRLSWQFISL
jgi:hypothetical protein